MAVTDNRQKGTAMSSRTIAYRALMLAGQGLWQSAAREMTRAYFTAQVDEPQMADRYRAAARRYGVRAGL